MSLDDKVKPAIICTPRLHPYKCHQTVLGVRAFHRPRLVLDHTVAYALLFQALSYAAEGNITKHLSNRGAIKLLWGHRIPTAHLGWDVLEVERLHTIRREWPPIHQLLVLPPPHPPPPPCHLLIYLMRNHNKCGE